MEKETLSQQFAAWAEECREYLHEHWAATEEEIDVVERYIVERGSRIGSADWQGFETWDEIMQNISVLLN